MIKINIVTAIIVLLVMEYLRRQYIDKKVKEEIQARLTPKERERDDIRYWECLTGQLGPWCKP